MRTITRVLPVAILVALVACGELPSQPRAKVPGELTVNLVAPNADDRAVLVQVTGPGAMTAVEAANASYLVHGRTLADTLRAVAFGPVKSGALLRFAVPDVGRAAEYSATVLEVGAAGGALRENVRAYRVTVTP